MSRAAIRLPNMNGKGRYTELTAEEQEAAYRKRIKIVEHNQFLLRMELAEMGAVRYVAPNDDEVRAAAEEIEKLTAQIKYGEARLKVLRSFLEPEPEAQEQSSDQSAVGR
jgi:hypothetical protein